MFKNLVLLVVLVVVGAIGYDYFTSNVDTTQLVEKMNTIVDDIQSDTSAVVTEPIENTTVVPLDGQQLEEPNGSVQTVEELKDAIYYYISRYQEQFTISLKGDTSQIEQMINEAYELIEQQDPYISGHLSDRNVQYTYTSRSGTLNFSQLYLTTYEQERYVNGKVQSIIDSLSLAAMSDEEKVKYVNDYIVQNTVYSEISIASPHSAYAVLFEGKGVCQGYALLAYKLLTEMGVEALYVTGEVNTGGHAWNLVKVNNEWYHLDTTWNDPVPDRGKDVRYDYFLINDQQMLKDHVWDRSKYPQALATWR